MALAVVHLSGDLDLTGIATVVLAVATAWLASQTRKSSGATEDEAHATQQLVQLTQREVEEAHRPVLVPSYDETRLFRPYGSSALPMQPQLLSAGVLAVPIENIGAGPALQAEATIELRDAAGNPTAAGTGGVIPRPVVAGVGVGQVQYFLFRIPGLGGVTGFRIEMSYWNVAGKRLRTVAHFAPSRFGYTDTVFDPGE